MASVVGHWQGAIEKRFDIATIKKMQNIGGDDGLPNTKCNVEDLQQVSETATANC